MEKTIVVGIAGWSIPREHANMFPAEGSHLARFSARFHGVEINSSFYRPHRPSTYERWQKSVPPGFQFAVKVPREITHRRRLVDASALLHAFLSEVVHLGPALGPLLVQLPPGLPFHHPTALAFFQDLRARHSGDVVCEPRHPTWFQPAVDSLLADHEVARVAADPAPVPDAAHPGGWPVVTYYRLHGSPQTYYSSYDDRTLTGIAAALKSSSSRRVWCVFDNTAAGAAFPNAIRIMNLL